MCCMCVWGGEWLLPLCERPGCGRVQDLGGGIVGLQKRRSGKPWATLCTTAWFHAKFLEPLGAASMWDEGLGATQPWPQAHSSELTHLLGKRFLFMSKFQLVKFYSSRKLVGSLRSYKGLG